MSEITIGQYLLDSLYERGVRHIFGLPGDYVLGFNKMIEKHKIQFINTTIENSAGYMADAYARLQGIGVASITYGVGIGITNSIAQAFVESSPVVLISGAAGTDEFLRSHYLHHLINKTTSTHSDLTQLEIFKQITVAQAVLDDSSLAKRQIEQVLDCCMSAKKPVYIELPRNYVSQEMQICATVKKPPSIVDLKVLEDITKDLKSLLESSQRPVIWAGHEIQRFGLSKSLIKFAEKFRIPIVSSLTGKCAISERHPLFVGIYQGEMSRPEVSAFVHGCDCVFILGAILSDVDTGIFSTHLKGHRVIANSENEVQVNSHYYHDVSLTNFLQLLDHLELKTTYNHSYPANLARKLPKFIPKSKKISVQTLFECVQSHLKPEHIVVTDIGDALFGSEDLILEQNSFLASAYFETLGFGTPGAIAAQLAMPDRRVIGIVGDGGFQMTAMELATAVRYGLDPIIIVLNNHGYGTERPLLEGSYNDIQDWNYAKIPEVLNGGTGYEVKTEEEFEKALINGLAQRGGFHLIEVELGKLDFSPTMKRFSALVKKKTCL